MIIDLFTEVKKSNDKFKQQLEYLANKEKTKRKIENWSLFMNQFVSLGDDFKQAIERSNKKLMKEQMTQTEFEQIQQEQIDLDFDEVMEAKMAQGEKKLNKNEMEKLNESAQKSIEFLINNIKNEKTAEKSSDMIVSDISSIKRASVISNDSGLVCNTIIEEPKEDSNLYKPIYNYDLTDEEDLDNENYSHEIIYKDSKGQSVSHQKPLNNILGNKEANIANFGDAGQKGKDKVYLFCNNKQIPDWAVDMTEIARKCSHQKEIGLMKRSFGRLFPVNNLKASTLFVEYDIIDDDRGTSMFISNEKPFPRASVIE